MSGKSETADCSTALDVSKIRAQRMAIRRDQLDRSTLERQRAVSTFPLVVAQVADDMRKMIAVVESGGESNGSREYLQYAEDIIREEFRNQFGRELGQ